MADIDHWNLADHDFPPVRAYVAIIFDGVHRVLGFIGCSVAID
ncbi:hypothetical protein [Paraburkholderia tagetis]|nr:hypothetical protein [Paraburkholderia tagetis]